jgi:hypothetical protein
MAHLFVDQIPAATTLIRLHSFKRVLLTTVEGRDGLECRRISESKNEKGLIDQAFLQSSIEHRWRRGRDSNPRQSCPCATFPGW